MDREEYVEVMAQLDRIETMLKELLGKQQVKEVSKTDAAILASMRIDIANGITDPRAFLKKYRAPRQPRAPKEKRK